MWLGGGRAGGRSSSAAGSKRRCASLLWGCRGVEGTDQPVERRVVDQIVHDVVEGILHSAQVDFAAGQHTVWQVPQPVSLAEAGVDLCGRAADGERLLLDVVGEALQAGDEDQAGGLELLGEGTSQGQGARLNGLSGADEQILITCDNSTLCDRLHLSSTCWVCYLVAYLCCPPPYLCLVTTLLVWATGLPHHQGAQLVIYHLVSPVNVLSAIFNLEKHFTWLSTSSKRNYVLFATQFRAAF